MEFILNILIKYIAIIIFYPAETKKKLEKKTILLWLKIGGVNYNTK